jgi:hypothetical protein
MRRSIATSETRGRRGIDATGVPGVKRLGYGSHCAEAQGVSELL